MDQAITLYEEATQRFTSTLGADHPETRRRLSELASAYGVAGQHEKAVPLKQTRVDFELRRGISDIKLANALSGLAMTLLAAGDFAAAAATSRESSTIWQELQPDSWRRFHTQCVLGGALAGQAHASRTIDKEIAQQQFSEAEQLLIEGYA